MNLKNSFNTPRAKQMALINALGTLLVFAAIASQSYAPSAARCIYTEIDFQAFWGAARLALSGEPLAAFDPLMLQESYSYCTPLSPEKKYWLYPAPALLLLTPIGVFPLFVAWMIFTTLSMLAFAIAVKPFCFANWRLYTFVVFTPALWFALTEGQLTLLWIAALLASLSLLRSDRPALAGVFIGLLTLKPTLGLLIPVALIANKNWRVIYYATVTTILLYSSTTLLYGSSYWPLWIEMTSQHGQDMLRRMGFVGLTPPIASFSYFIARLGLDPVNAVKCTVVFTAVLACVVFAVWRKLGAKSDIAAATLVTAIPLATPYLWHYDAAFTVIAGLLLLRAHQGPITHWWWLFYAACWVGPGLALANQLTFNIEILKPVWTVPPLLLAILLVSIRAAFAQPKLTAD